jgi:hypothetical protein
LFLVKSVVLKGRMQAGGALVARVTGNRRFKSRNAVVVLLVVVASVAGVGRGLWCGF